MVTCMTLCSPSNKLIKLTSCFWIRRGGNKTSNSLFGSFQPANFVLPQFCGTSFVMPFGTCSISLVTFTLDLNFLSAGPLHSLFSLPFSDNWSVVATAVSLALVVTARGKQSSTRKLGEASKTFFVDSAAEYVTRGPNNHIKLVL